MADNTFRYVSALISEGSFSKAAQSLDISQPSLSQFVHRLEAELGTDLIDRTTKPVRLTYAGECFMQTEKQIVELRQLRSKRIADIGSGVRGHVRIGASHYRSTFFLTSVLPLYKVRYPNIEISLEEGTTRELEELVLTGRTDVSLVLSPLDHPELQSVDLYTEKLLLAVSTMHPLAQQAEKSVLYPPVAFDQMDEEPFITIKSGQKFHTLFYQLCDRFNVKPKVVLESESPMAALALASVGLGATLVTETLARRTQTPAPVQYFSFSPEIEDRQVVAAFRKNQYQSKALLALRDVMREVGQREFIQG